MKFAIAFLFAINLAAAQPLLTVSGPAGNVKAGSAVTLTVTLSGSAGQNVAAIGGSIANPGVQVIAPPGAVAVAAGKVCDSAVTGGALVFIVYGINGNAMSDGVVAQLQLTLPASAQSGTQVEALSILSAASLAGDGLAITAGTPFSFATISLCDLDGSGTVDATDVSALKVAITSRTGTPDMDLNGDGKIDAVDLQRIINAARGQACRVGA